MKQSTKYRLLSYAVAIALHALVLFGIQSYTAATIPPKKETYLEITLESPPVPEPPTITPAPPAIRPLLPPPPAPPVKPPPAAPIQAEPPPTPTPEVAPPSVAESPSEPTPPPVPQPIPATVQTAVPAVAPAAMPAPPSPYRNVTQPAYASRVEPDYPAQARRLHQQGTVTLALYINEAGSLDKVEIVKSSGSRLLDATAADAMQQSRFHPAYEGNTPVPSRAEVSITFRLEQ